jgi:hypothetical protein
MANDYPLVYTLEVNIDSLFCDALCLYPLYVDSSDGNPISPYIMPCYSGADSTGAFNPLRIHFQDVGDTPSPLFLSPAIIEYNEVGTDLTWLLTVSIEWSAEQVTGWESTLTLDAPVLVD